ncbi:hypothetical protein ACFVWG_38275 [Kribbella sp. NPDC058245]|uniref:hypothetical protein n=1 Tax=Kribbella sp. NPDC058245 TaxID=3346399 RepID=UPI0036EAF306
MIELSNESRMIATPWSRMVRGIGLGQYPVDYDPVAAEWVRRTFDQLSRRVSPANSYTLFARHLSELILQVNDPNAFADVNALLDPVLAAVRAEQNPYYRLMAGCILLDSFAKLQLDVPADFPAEVLAGLDAIEPNAIKDENSGRHGEYERLSACTAVFLALGQLGLADRLVTAERNYIVEALGLLEQIPAPFFRGRGGSMLLSVCYLLGYGEYVRTAERDHVEELLEYLDRADELELEPSFPSAMSALFPRIYPLVTLMNAIAMSGRAEYLTYRKDRLAELRWLMGGITDTERTHMGLYYIVALHNLGRLDEQLPDLNGFVDSLVGQWKEIDPGEDYFLRGISYPYLISTAMVTGRLDLLTEETFDRLADAYPDLERADADRDNRPYPVSYALNMLGEIGEAGRLFRPRLRYDGRAPLQWVIERVSEDGVREGNRLYMLDHSLISYALRLRGANAPESELFRDWKWQLA